MSATFSPIDGFGGWAIALMLLIQIMYLVWNVRFLVLFTRTPRRRLYDDDGYEVVRNTNFPFPLITILMPVRKEEEAVLKRNLDSIGALNYSHHRMEILVVADSDDHETIRTAEGLAGRYQFPVDIIVVPEDSDPRWVPILDEWHRKGVKWLKDIEGGIPKMKPRALAFALPHIRGQITTVVDAEDVQADPDVLLKATYCLKVKGLDAVQGRLKFVNYRDSWLSLHAVGDYSLWFDWMMPRLKKRGLPVPLAGTSYYIRTDVLKQVSGWDPSNMTEDLELGVRLYCYGYRIGMIDSDTFEEAPRRFFRNSHEGGWLNQRTRWCRGVSFTLKSVLRHRKEFPARRMLTIFFVMFYYILGWSVQITNILGYPLSGLFLVLLPIFGLPTWLVGLFALNGILLSWCIYSTGSGIARNIGETLPSLGEKLRYYGLFGGTVIFYWFVWVAPAVRALKQQLMEPIFWEKTDHLGLHHPVCDRLLGQRRRPAALPH